MRENKRIGFVLATVHKGSTERLWHEIARRARHDGAELFIFPSGRIGYLEEYEYLRQSIIRLVNHDNLDALISWSSAMGGSISSDELQNFHYRYGSLPFVTLGMSVPGSPSVVFDAYSGMKAEVEHMITIHDSRRIAFLRSPVWHGTGMERFYAYKDALSENGIEYDPLLVSSPHAWSEGRNAIEELIGRGLVPGRDFDTLIASSDLMMFDACEYLLSLGYEAPRDYLVAGFNNSYEAQLLRSSATTVELPYFEMGSMGWNIASYLADGEVLTGDVKLPCRLIVRRSCGCKTSFSSPERAKLRFQDLSAYIGWVKSTFSLSRRESEWIEAFVDSALTGKKDLDSFNPELFRYVENYLSEGGDISLLYEAIEWLVSIFPVSDGFKKYAGGVLLPYVGILGNRVHRMKEYAKGKERDRLNSLKCDLLCTRSIGDICTILSRNLPSLGINEAYLVLGDGENDNNFVGGFIKDELLEGGVLFDRMKLLPPEIDSRITRGIHVVEPLFMENQPLGYIIFKTTKDDGVLLEELRSSISSAMKGASLLDSLNEAKDRAESMERSKSLMFLAISDGMKEPIENIKNVIASLNIEDRYIEKELRRLSYLVDLSLSEVDDLSSDLVFTPLSSIFNSQNALPLCLMDKTRIEELIELLKSICGEDHDMVHDMTPEGFRLRFSFSRGLPSLLYSEPALLLSEKIIMMHEGHLKVGNDFIEVLIPWPSLKGGRASFCTHELYRLNDIDGLSNIAELSLDDIDEKKPITVMADLDRLSFENLHMLDCLNKCEDVLLVPYSSRPGSRDVEELIRVNSGRAELGYLLILGSSFILPNIGDSGRRKVFSEFSPLRSELAKEDAEMIVISQPVTEENIQELRRMTRAPIVVINDEQMQSPSVFLSIPDMICVNICIMESEEFLSRLKKILFGAKMLPANTSDLVKKAIAFIENNASRHIARWQVADSIHVNEDYMARIFKKELGISPWDYMNRYRIHIASRLLRESAKSIGEIAYDTGFQDQAYFCRVYKRIKGVAPGKERQR